MTRLQILFPLLLIWFVLMVQQHNASSSSFQETKSVSFKISTGAYNSRKRGSIQKASRNRKEVTEKKVRKIPSGPSPVGNHRPPSKA